MAEKNKLNIYYIKRSKEINDVFKDDLRTYKTIEFAEGTLYYNPKNVRVPDWVEGFFEQKLVRPYTKEDGTKGECSIFNTAYSQAVFLKQIKYRGVNHLFAITFGNGFQLLKSDAFEPNFGLKCVLNLVSGNNGLRKISKYDISSTPKRTSQQLSKKGSLIDFSLDYQSDILTGITGNFDPKNKRDKILTEYIGKTITGSNSLSVNANANIRNVDRILRLSIISYKSENYKRYGFSWIDNVSYIKHDSILLEQLNNELDKKLASLSEESDKIWFAVPEIIKWEDIKGFYFGGQKTVLKDDLDLLEYKQYIMRKEGAAFNIDRLKQSHIYAKNAKGDGYLYCWDAFQCLNVELELHGKTFMLINKNWYEVNPTFQKETNEKFEDYFHNKSGLGFIDCAYQDEETYNKEMAKQKKMICLDKKIVSYGGGNSKIEVCDLLDEQSKKIIHVKKYSGSSVLSHLFSQGLVSMQLLIRDKAFLNKTERVISKIKGNTFSFNGARNYGLVYAIITKSGRNTINMPFFSKVNLNSMCDRLCRDMNLTVYFDVIKNTYISNKKK